MTKLIESLPFFMRKSKVYREIFNAEAKQFDNFNDYIDDFKKQMAIDTATWALDIYEAELEIPTDLNKPLDERRSVIKSKLRGTGKVDATLIKMVADAYTNGEVEVEFDGSIIIRFTSVRGQPPNIEDVYFAVDEIKPAHLPVLYIFLYNTNEYLKQFTHLYLSQYVHDEIRNTDI